jgi:hypothetical protein
MLAKSSEQQLSLFHLPLSAEAYNQLAQLEQRIHSIHEHNT